MSHTNSSLRIFSLLRTVHNIKKTVTISILYRTEFGAEGVKKHTLEGMVIGEIVDKQDAHGTAIDSWLHNSRFSVEVGLFQITYAAQIRGFPRF